MPVRAKKTSTGCAKTPRVSIAVVEELSDAYTQLAIQDHAPSDVMNKLTVQAWTHQELLVHAWNGLRLEEQLIARTGYTGEDGFEIYVPSDVPTSEKSGIQMMQAGREFAIIPAAWEAGNTLRLESKWRCYGHEISDKIMLWEAGLDRYCKMEKGTLWDAQRWSEQRAGSRRTLVGSDDRSRHCARRYCCCNEAGEAIAL